MILSQLPPAAGGALLFGATVGGVLFLAWACFDKWLVKRTAKDQAERDEIEKRFDAIWWDAFRESHAVAAKRLRAHEEREWQRLEHCPICQRPAQSSTYAHVNPQDTHAEQIRRCVSGHTWSRKMRLESMPEYAPVPPRTPVEDAP